MSNIEDFFLELLRVGLWGQKPSQFSSLSFDEWGKVMTEAMQHAVVGVVMDGFSYLDDEQKPPKEIIMKWFPYLLQIERENKRLDETAISVWNRLNDEGIKTVLLKGQGVAKEYLVPEHRQSGDVDLYVCHGNIDGARRVVMKWDIQDTGENIKHYFFSLDGIEVELHRRAVNSYFLPASRRLNIWMNRKLNSTQRKWGSVTIPDEEFNIVFEFNHLFEHFMGEGVGLRQICDWIVCLYHAVGKFNVGTLEYNLNRFNQLHSWKVFAYIAVNYLGLSEEQMPLYDNNYQAKAEKVMAIIMKNGNFGRYAGKRKRPNSYLGSKVYTITENIRSTINMFPIFPTDAIRNLENPIDAASRIYFEIRHSILKK